MNHQQNETYKQQQRPVLQDRPVHHQMEPTWASISLDVLHGHIDEDGSTGPAEVPASASTLTGEAKVARRTDPVPLGPHQAALVGERLAS